MASVGKRQRDAVKEDPTVTMQACPVSGALGVSFGTTLLVARFEPNATVPTTVSTVNCSIAANVDATNEESIRTFKFLNVPHNAASSAPTSLPAFAVVAGDEKMVKLVDLTTAGTASAVVSAVGPFAKKITNLEVYIPSSPAEFATYPPNFVATVVLADKFGDVHYLHILRSRSGLELVRPLPGSPGFVTTTKAVVEKTDEKDAGSSDEDDDDKAQFLLQHMSVLSQLLITTTPSHNRRLITADKDCHTRVSAYPHSYVIDQFLWPSHPAGEEQAPVSALLELSLGSISGATGLVMGDSLGRVTFWTCNNATPTEQGESPQFVQAGSISLAALHKERLTDHILTGTSTASDLGRAFLQRGKELGSAVAKHKKKAAYEAAEESHVASRLGSSEVDKWMLEQHLLCKHSSLGGVVGIAQVRLGADTGVVVALEGAPFMVYIPFFASANGISADTASLQVIELPQSCPVANLTSTFSLAADASPLQVSDRAAVLLRNGLLVWVVRTASGLVVEPLESAALQAQTQGEEPFKTKLATADPFSVWRSVFHEKQFAQKLVLDAIQTN